MRWCDLDDMRGAMRDLDAFLERVPSRTWDEFAEAATGRAASYLGKYRQFFTSWDNAAAPQELRRAVAAIAVWDLASACAALAPQDLQDSPWRAQYDDAMNWLRDISARRADLAVHWPGWYEKSGTYMRISRRTTPSYWP